MTDILSVADYLYKYYFEITNEKIDELKMHKLLYFIQRECIAMTGEPMFNDSFEGWIHGPVSTEVRLHFDQEHGIVAKTHEVNDTYKYIIQNVVYQYGNYASWYLRDLSHKEISWKNSRKGLTSSQPGNKELKLDDIKIDAEKVRPYDHLWDMYYDEFEDYNEFDNMEN